MKKLFELNYFKVKVLTHFMHFLPTQVIPIKNNFETINHRETFPTEKITICNNRDCRIKCGVNKNNLCSLLLLPFN